MKMKWDKEFIKNLARLSGPIILQNLFSVLGNSVTTFMTGLLGDAPIAAAGLNSQLYFILMLTQFGVGSGCSLFSAQYWGKKDHASIRKTLGVSLVMGLSIGALFLFIALLLPRQFLSLFTENEEVINLATGLLRITGFSFLFTPVIFSYSFILRSVDQVRLPMTASIAGVILNILLGYALVFGKISLPELGVNGAAVSLLAARGLECAVLVILAYRKKTPLAAHFNQIFSFDKVFTRKVLKRAFPVMSNELIWGLGIAAYNAIFARLGVEAYAAVAIRITIDDILFVPITGLVSACAILVGNAIGSGNQRKAQGYVRQAVAINFLLSVSLGAIVFLSRGLILSYFNISETTQFFAMNLIAIMASFVWVRSTNFMFFVGALRSGGDTRFAWVMDVLALWVVGIPLALWGAFVLRWPVYFVYLLIMTEELVKFPFLFWRFRSRRWVHDLVS